MKKHQSKTSKINKTKQKRRQVLLNKIFFSVVTIGILHYLFVESHCIGSDKRYDLFVIWIPTLIGFFISLKFNVFEVEWKRCISDLKKEKNYFYKFFTIPILILTHFFFAIIMFWIPSNIIWDGLNKMEAKNNKIELFSVPVKQFQVNSKGSDLIYFNFKNHLESVRVDYQTIKPYLDKNPKNYKIKLEVRKGIWNYYVLENFDIL